MVVVVAVRLRCSGGGGIVNKADGMEMVEQGWIDLRYQAEWERRKAETFVEGEGRDAKWMRGGGDT